MQKLQKLTLLVLALLFSITVFGQSKALKPIEIEKVPTSVEEFVQMRDQIAQTPEGGAATMVVAMMLYVKDPNIGLPCLTIAINRELLSQGNGGYKGYTPRRSDMDLIKRQLKQHTYLPNSYVIGTSPDKGYVLPEKLRFEFTSNPYSGDKSAGRYKIFVKCSGADSPRPIELRKNNRGIWKAHNWSSLLSGARKPKVEIDDDF